MASDVKKKQDGFLVLSKRITILRHELRFCEADVDKGGRILGAPQIPPRTPSKIHLKLKQNQHPAHQKKALVGLNTKVATPKKYHQQQRQKRRSKQQL